MHQMIPRWLRTRGSSRCFPLFVNTMCYNAIVLSNGHVYQLIKIVGADKIKMPSKLGVKTTTETILLLGITIGMMTGVLA